MAQDALTTTTREDSDGFQADADVLQRLLDDRWSCRGFLDRPVPRPVIEHVLDLARRSPSWCNTQPWQVMVTQGEATERLRRELSAHAANHELAPDFGLPIKYEGVYQQRRRECAFQLYGSVGVERGDREASAVQAAKNFQLFGAPHAALVTTEANLGVSGAIDCGLYVETFLLAAQSLGLGAIPQAALAMYPQFMRDFFQLPDSRLLVCGISFGWPDPDHPANQFRTTRLPAPETVTWFS